MQPAALQRGPGAGRAPDHRDRAPRVRALPELLRRPHPRRRPGVPHGALHAHVHAVLVHAALRRLHAARVQGLRRLRALPLGRV
jgi:hypothetical protein